ncbi:MAG: sel1 repeat family protein [Sphingosinicella sp.]|nr:sel1 repeat family protein [Sphingosinicella sp.]
MRLPAIASFPVFLLAGCTSGYTLDYLRAETSLVAPKLPRYGLDPAQTQCVAARLAANLTVVQMRRLGDVAGLAVRQGAAPLPLNLKDLSWVSTRVRDPQIPRELTKALDGCGLLEAENSGAPQIAVRAPGGDEIIPSVEIITGDLPKSGGTASSRVNGPPDYQPHADLLKALDAYEAGNKPEAVRLAKIAAEKGDSGAQQFLAGLYSAGIGVAADPIAAATYYARAAEQGWSEAMNNLGQAYEAGQGVPRDKVIALKWYLLASARPTEDAEKVARNLENLVRDMSPEQIQKAAALAREWERNYGS